MEKVVDEYSRVRVIKKDIREYFTTTTVGARICYVFVPLGVNFICSCFVRVRGNDVVEADGSGLQPHCTHRVLCFVKTPFIKGILSIFCS